METSLRRTTGRLAAALAVVLPVIPAVAAQSAPLSRQTFTIVRTAPLSAASDWNIGVGWANSGIRAFVGIMGVRVERGRPVGAGDTLFATLGDGDTVEVRAEGHTLRPCADWGVCEAETTTLGAASSESYSDKGEAGVNNRFYVVVEATSAASIDFHAHGWKLQRTRLSYRWLDSNQTDSPQVRALDSGVEVFTSGHLAGGRYGSAASITPPCSNQYTPPLPEGVGQLTLSAPGVSDQSATCPASPWSVTSFSRRPTTWTVHGVSAGQNGFNTARLFVVDFPARP